MANPGIALWRKTWTFSSRHQPQRWSWTLQRKRPAHTCNQRCHCGTRSYYENYYFIIWERPSTFRTWFKHLQNMAWWHWLHVAVDGVASHLLVYEYRFWSFCGRFHGQRHLEFQIHFETQHPSTSACLPAGKLTTCRWISYPIVFFHWPNWNKWTLILNFIFKQNKCIQISSLNCQYVWNIFLLPAGQTIECRFFFNLLIGSLSRLSRPCLFWKTECCSVIVWQWQYCCNLFGMNITRQTKKQKKNVYHLK